MSINTANENICINKIITQKEENFIIEGDEIVPDIKPDILNIISTNGTVCVYKKEIQDGNIKIDGSVNIYTLYIAEDENGSTRCINSCLDFSKNIDLPGIKSDMKFEAVIKIKSIDAKILNGRKINLKAILDVEISVYSNEYIDILRDIEDVDDIQKLNRVCNINSLIGSGSTNVYAKETLKLDKSDNVLEIVRVKTNITNKETKASYNKVLGKAELNVKIVYLTDDNRINSSALSIPIMGFIDIPNVNEKNTCEIKYQLRNLIVKPNNIEDHSIQIEAEVEENCFVYDNREIQIIEDFYSPTRELEYNQNNIKILKNIRNIKQICNIRKQEKISEIGKNRIYDVEVIPVILNKKISEGRIYYEGEIKFVYLFATNDDGRGINSKTIVEPFNFSIADDQINSDTRIETNIEELVQDFIVMPDESIDVRVDLEFDLSVIDSEDLNIIDSVKENESKSRETYSIVIYYTRPGDTLWNIAKRFGSTVEEIVKINNIENENKIMPGDQLFIPR